MKTLSIIQPWATLICSGIKDVENRTWAPPTDAIGQKLLIHASAKKCSPAAFNDLPFEWLSEISNAIVFGWIPEPQDIPTGAIIGYVDLVGFAPKTDSLWDGGDDCVKWLFENAYMFDEPIPAKGRLGVFDTPMEELPPAHKVITLVPHREGDVLVMPYCDSLVGNVFENKIVELDLTDENLALLTAPGGDGYQPANFKMIRLVTPERTVDFPVVYSEVFLDTYEDTGAPILYTSLRGEEYGKYVIAFSSEPLEYFEK